MELDSIFDSDSDNSKPFERRIRFTGKSKEFIKKMEAKGFPISNLVNFIVEQCTPMYENKGFTYEGYDRLKQQIRNGNHNPL